MVWNELAHEREQYLGSPSIHDAFQERVFHMSKSNTQGTHQFTMPTRRETCT